MRRISERMETGSWFRVLVDLVVVVVGILLALQIYGPGWSDRAPQEPDRSPPS